MQTVDIFSLTMYMCVTQAVVETDNNVQTVETSSLTMYMCVTGCGMNRWQCANGRCIYLLGRCDNFPDCLDESDERGCSVLGNYYRHLVAHL